MQGIREVMFDALDELRNGDAGQNQSTDAQERMSSNLDEKYDTEGVHWALARNVMSLSEARLIWEAVDNIMSRDYVYRKTAQGEYIIESEDALFFVRADAHEPYLDRIICFSDGYWASIGFGKEEIANASNSDLEIREALSFLKEVYGEGFANEYQASDERTDGRKAGRGKRTSRGEVHRADGRGKNHAGNETGSESGTVKRYSVRDDSEGRKLSDGQEDYFAESAIRDKNGALQVMYHGTDNDFTVFSREYLGENTDAWSEEAQATAHIGFWFNTQNLSQNGKALYARAEEVYLNVTNPYDAGDLYGLVDEIAAVNEESSEDPSEIGEKFRDWLEENGYDGVRLHDEEFGGTSVAALYPEQIKRTDNLNPTEDADIRYSLRDSAMGDLDDASTYSYENLTSQKDMQVVTIADTYSNPDSGSFHADVVQKAMAAVRAKNNPANTQRRAFVTNTYTGQNIQITPQSIRHGLKMRRKALDVYERAALQIGDIVENAIPVNQLKPREGIDSSYLYIGIAEDSERYYPVTIVVNRVTETQLEAEKYGVLPNFEKDYVSSLGTKKGTSRLPRRGLGESHASNVPTITVADFLQIVKPYYADGVSKSVLNMLGVSDRPSGTFSNGAMFSLRDTSTVDVETVLNENAQLREANEELRKQFRRTVGVQLDQNAIRKMARDLLKQYDSSYDVDTLTDNLSKVFDVVANGGLTWDEASSAVVDMCRKVLEESSSFDTELYDYDQPVRDYLKNVRLEISDDMRGGIELVADNGAAYRRGLFGIVGVARNVRLNGMRKQGNSDTF